MWDFSKFSDNIAILEDNGEAITYSEMEKLGNDIAMAVGGRTLVFLLCKNEIGAMLGYSGFVNNNIVPVLLNANLDRELMVSLLETYQPSHLWLPNALCEEFLQNYSFAEIAVMNTRGYSLLKTNYNTKHELFPELCLLLTTSGSTGSPKFVRQSYRNVEHNAKSIVQYLKIDSSEKPVTTLPMNYTYGLSIINSHFMEGATVLATEKSFMQREFWNFIKREEATSFGGVPYTYEMLDKLRFTRMNLPALRYMTQAGGKLTPELHKKFAEYAEAAGKKFFVMYGQCEATARMAYLPAEKSLEKCGSMGIPIPGGKFKLIDSDGEEINTPNVTGELVYEGENVTLGYAECISDLAKGDERKGVLQTGDMALVDESGYYYIVGRKKRFLKIYGNRVNLDEIDRMIKAQFNHLDCASAGVDDHMYLFVTDSSVAEKVKEFVVGKTKLNPVAFKVITVDEIPKNDAGKILYKELEKYYQ